MRRSDQEGELLDAIRSVVDGGHPRLLVRGEAGIGKTRLVHRATAADTVPDVLVLRTTGAESEAELAFQGLADLLRPLTQLVDQLPVESAAAIRALTGSTATSRLDRFAEGRAATDLLAVAASVHPVLVVVDDVQWFDDASLDALLFAARRLADEPVGVLFARRDSGGDPPAPRGFTEVVLGGLDDPDAADLFRSSAGVAPHPEVVRAVVEAAGGNPLALTEAPRALTDEQLRGVRPLPDPLPVGSAITSGFAARVTRLPEATRLALTVLAAGDVGPLRVLGPALAEVGATLGDLDAAESTGVIVVDQDAGAFRHPLLRSVAWSTAGPSDRRRAHAAVAAVLPAADERRGWHLAAAADGPDDAAADALDAAARSAGRLGGHASASAAHERSARLTARPEEAADRLLRAAESAWRAGNLARAGALLAEVRVSDLGDGGLFDTERLTARLAAAAGGREREAADHFERAAEAALGPSPAVLALVEAARAVMRRGFDPEIAKSLSSRAVSLAATVEGPVAVVADVADLAARMLAGEHALLDPLRERTVELLAHDDLLEETGPLATEAARVIFTMQDPRGALHVLGALEDWARRRRNLAVLPVALLIKGEVLQGRGRHRLAREALEDARDLAAATGDDDTLVRAEFFLTRLSLYDDETGQIPELLVALMAGGGEMGLRARSVVGRRHLWAGQYDLAVAELEQIAVVLDQVGWPDPAANPWEHDRVEALAMAGRTDAARRALAEFEGRAAGIDNAMVQRQLDKARGLVADTVDDVDRHFTRALEFEDPTPYQIGSVEIAWARRLVALGHPDAALPHAQRAFEVIERFGAGGLTAAVRAELDRMGHPPPDAPEASQELSTGERRVAAALAGGADPEAIAGEMAIPVVAVHRFAAAAARKGSGGPLPASLAPEAHAGPGSAALPGPSPAAPAAPAGVSIRTLGRFDVRRDGQPVHLAPAVASAVKVVVAAGGSIPVDQLIDRFWPEADPEAGRSRLRTVLARVRRSAGDVLVRRDELVELADGTSVDSLAFEAEALDLVRRGDVSFAEVQRAIAGHTGTFLPGDLYEPWSVAPRARIDRRYLALLERGAELAIAEGELTEAEELFDRMATLEPDDEERLVVAGSRLLAAGRRASAGRFARLARRACDELGVPPSEDLTRLEAQTRRTT
jgi:DNA-binding SARP family transcriptional activator